jgi:hypothetical protein
LEWSGDNHDWISWARFLHDKAPAHNSRVTIAAKTDCGFEIFPHPQYSTDLTPSDFYLLSKLKTNLCGRRFYSNEGVMEGVNEFFEDQNRAFYFEGLNNLEHRWTKCIDVGAIILKSKTISLVLWLPKVHLAKNSLVNPRNDSRKLIWRLQQCI